MKNSRRTILLTIIVLASLFPPAPGMAAIHNTIQVNALNDMTVTPTVPGVFLLD